MQLPKFTRIRQKFPTESVSDLETAVSREIKHILADRILPAGAKIAITAGSRGIHNIIKILRISVETIREAGYSPFLFAATGSHGRGEAAGQREIFQSLGIDEESIGSRISCSSEVEFLGTTDQFLPGLAVYAAKEAAEADAVLVVNRVKPHTNFSGEFESGLMKMMAVGMGRAVGASNVHRLGNEYMVDAIKAIGSVILNRLPILGGLAILENAYEETAQIKGVRAEDIWKEEPALLHKAKSLLPSLPIDDIDLCVVHAMGKNYSGTGMDTNIIGRLRIAGMNEPSSPRIKYLGVLDLTDESHGNATGIGLADFTTEKLVRKIDTDATYTNVLTSGNVIRAAVPMTMKNDRELFFTAMKALKPADPAAVKAVIIKNTLQMEELWISEPLLAALADMPEIEVAAGPTELMFDDQQNLVLA